MRLKTFIILLICAIMFAWADSGVLLTGKKHGKSSMLNSIEKKDSLDSIQNSKSNNRNSDKDEGKDENDEGDNAETDTTQMDSLQLAVYHHNKAVDDSIRADSINRAKSNGIDAPVNYSAKDSLVYDAMSRTSYLYGSSEVKYENMDLQSDKIRLSLDSSLVHAYGSPDSTEKTGVKGKPIFKMGSDTYDTDTMAFNFKTKKGLVQNT